ncbi:YkgJ family cysteine cluster protein [Algoriphagus lutimaris]|uniref:YkgJ family cysteine cluster protein n=1 Tax=Algoriphagus lutimaris TaxID=613197 RepID=UPI001FAFD5AB|nr:YkgJ family cysteine cluster protein [Algoriphagus lutimaris]
MNISLNLEEKSLAVLKVFKELEEEAKQFTSGSGLSCLSGCGACCANPQIPASALEFLPLAFDFFNKGLAETILSLIESGDDQGNCIVYRTNSISGRMGYCTNYVNRGMICRLFAASARKNKYGQKDIIICKTLKEQKQEAFLAVTKRINEDLPIPSASKFYMYLEEIDESLCKQLPINQAIAFALELVLRFKYYQQEVGQTT